MNIENLPYLQRHHKVGKFCLRSVIDSWTEKLIQALASGYVRKGIPVPRNDFTHHE